MRTVLKSNTGNAIEVSHEGDVDTAWTMVSARGIDGRVSMLHAPLGFVSALLSEGVNAVEDTVFEFPHFPVFEIGVDGDVLTFDSSSVVSSLDPFSGRVVCPQPIVIDRDDVNALVALVSQARSIEFVDDSVSAA